MEMTFPHPVKRGVTRHSCRAVLAAAIARQANTRTARAVLTATQFPNTDCSENVLNKRILYFGSQNLERSSVFGPFWAARRSQDTADANYESCVYQDGSMNNKARDLIGVQSWKQFVKPGHGASRTT